MVSIAYSSITAYSYAYHIKQDFKLKCRLVAILLGTLYPSKLEAGSFNISCTNIGILLLCLLFSISATTGLLPEGTQCACIGERLTYNCNVVGSGTSVWSGTVFDCPMDGSLIILRHSQFASNRAFGICNNGDIVGRGVRVVNDCYMSQLNVTVRESYNNKTIQCISNLNEGMRTVGQSTLSIVSGMCKPHVYTSIIRVVTLNSLLQQQTSIHLLMTFSLLMPSQKN